MTQRIPRRGLRRTNEISASCVRGGAHPPWGSALGGVGFILYSLNMAPQGGGPRMGFGPSVWSHKNLERGGWLAKLAAGFRGGQCGVGSGPRSG